MKGDFVDDDPTPVLQMAQSDRVILERKFEALALSNTAEHARMWERFEAERAEDAARAATFYETRMLPLEARVLRNRIIVWCAITAALVSGLFNVVLVIMLVES